MQIQQIYCQAQNREPELGILGILTSLGREGIPHILKRYLLIGTSETSFSFLEILDGIREQYQRTVSVVLCQLRSRAR